MRGRKKCKTWSHQYQSPTHENDTSHEIKLFTKKDAKSHYKNLKGNFWIPSIEIIKIRGKIRAKDLGEGVNTYKESIVEYGGHFVFDKETGKFVTFTFRRGNVSRKGSHIDLYSCFEEDARCYTPKNHCLIPYHVHPRYNNERFDSISTRWEKKREEMVKQGKNALDIDNEELRFHKEHIINAAIPAIFLSYNDIKSLDECELSQHILFISDDFVVNYCLNQEDRNKRKMESLSTFMDIIEPYVKKYITQKDKSIIGVIADTILDNRESNGICIMGTYEVDDNKVVFVNNKTRIRVNDIELNL